MCARDTTLGLYRLLYKSTREYSTKPINASGPFGPRCCIARNPARYVAQVQIGPVLKNPIRSLARDTTYPILDYFIDENGEVKPTRFL